MLPKVAEYLGNLKGHLGQVDQLKQEALRVFCNGFSRLKGNAQFLLRKGIAFGRGGFPDDIGDFLSIVAIDGQACKGDEAGLAGAGFRLQGFGFSQWVDGKLCPRQRGLLSILAQRVLGHLHRAQCGKVITGYGQCALIRHLRHLDGPKVEGVAHRFPLSLIFLGMPVGVQNMIGIALRDDLLEVVCAGGELRRRPG